MENTAASQLSTLGHPQRLAVFRLLVRRYPDSVPAGEIATALELKSSTLSVYLSALMKADLITQSRDGTSRLYVADMSKAGALISYLFYDCCRGRPDVCLPLLSADSDKGAPMTHRSYNVLFVCTGNSARSVIAEQILKEVGGDRFQAFSAGITPFSDIDPLALALLQSKGYETGGLYSKSISEFRKDEAPQMDFVFTVCDLAANEDCPLWASQPVSAHWGVADPAAIAGTLTQKQLAFQQAYGALRNRIEAFASLPFEQLDRASLQNHVDDIGQSKDTE